MRLDLLVDLLDRLFGIADHDLALLLVVVDDGLGLLEVGHEPFLENLRVVVAPPAALGSLDDSLGHGFLRG